MRGSEPIHYTDHNFLKIRERLSIYTVESARERAELNELNKMKILYFPQDYLKKFGKIPGDPSSQNTLP